MGSYNSQYQSYYASLSKSRRNNPYSRGASSSSNSNPLARNRIVKRIFRELVGVFCLLIIILACKVVKTPETIEVYNYCKDIVNYNYDYKAAFESIKTVNLQEVSGKIEDYIENIKAQITGEQTYKDKINNEFIIPVQGEVTLGYGTTKNPETDSNIFHYGIDIATEENAKVVSSSEGVVKFIGEDAALGKYLIIDHGIGIETKYGNLKDIKVENGAGVAAGEVIAEVGSSAETETPHLHFELLYMGENKDPEEYINFMSIPQ